MDDQPIYDGHITADFIGGVWDGKQYDIPFVPEWRIAMLLVPDNKPEHYETDPKFVGYDIAVYKYIGYGIYWFSRIEKNG